MIAQGTAYAAWTALFIFAPCGIAGSAQADAGAYYVGTRALASILITSSSGHVLIDGTVQEAAPLVAANVRSLGFRVEDIRMILNSHVHFDHAGAIAALQRMSDAQVAASPASARVLLQGHSDPDDPQFASLSRGPTPVEHVRILEDREAVTVGPLVLTPYFTPGHTPGGTTWTWRSCERGRCLNMVYADSLSVVSAEGFKFSQNTEVLQEFADRAAAAVDRCQAITSRACLRARRDSFAARPQLCRPDNSL